MAISSTCCIAAPGPTPEIIGGTEETTTGVIRLRAMEANGVLGYPSSAINDADTKHLFDNRYGTGQSAMDGIIRATNVLIAGRTVVVCGYGMCGRGVASRAKGHGGRRHRDRGRPDPGSRGCDGRIPGDERARGGTQGDIFITVTGNKHVLRDEHFEVMKDGAILANAGHFDIEIDLATLGRCPRHSREVRPEVGEFTLEGDRTIYVLGEGRLVNLAAAEGHPASVMDMSFANQALSCEWLAQERTRSLEKKVYRFPRRSTRRSPPQARHDGCPHRRADRRAEGRTSRAGKKAPRLAPPPGFVWSASRRDLTRDDVKRSCRNEGGHAVRLTRTLRCWFSLDGKRICRGGWLAWADAAW